MSEIFYVLLFLQLMDGLSTWLVIRNGGYEANPVLVKLAEFLRRFTGAKWAWLAFIKIVGISASWFLAFNAPAWVCYALIALYVVVVINNFSAYRKQIGHSNKGNPS